MDEAQRERGWYLLKVTVSDQPSPLNYQKFPKSQYLHNIKKSCAEGPQKMGTRTALGPCGWVNLLNKGPTFIVAGIGSEMAM